MSVLHHDHLKTKLYTFFLLLQAIVARTIQSSTTILHLNILLCLTINLKKYMSVLYHNHLILNHTLEFTEMPSEKSKKSKDVNDRRRKTN